MKYKTLTYAVVMSMSILTAPLALADLNDGLVAYYPFNGNANDESGNGNDGTEHGGLNYAVGKIGQAAQFDGIDDYINVADNDSLDNTSYLTIAVWVNFRSFHATGTHTKTYLPIINKHFSSEVKGRNSYGLSLHSESKNVGFSAFNPQNLSGNASASPELELGLWNHLVSIFDNGQIKMFLNGSLITSQETNITQIGNSPEPLKIGDWFYQHSASYPTRYSTFEGLMDDIRIYNRALSEDEVKTLAGVPKDGDCQHATYSLKKRTLTVPFVEMPVVDFLTGQPTGKMELWTGSLKQVFGTTNRFRLINKTVAQITDGSNSSCPATYAVDTGTLNIPYIDVPTGIAVGNQNFENNVEVFKATMTWEPMGKSFVVQEVEMLP